MFCLLCLTAWHWDCSQTGLPDHKQIHTNSSGQLKNQVASQSWKCNICAVVNSPHSVPHAALDITQFAICLHKSNWISLLLCCHYSISWSGYVLTGNTTKSQRDTFWCPWSKMHLTRHGGQNEAYWHMWGSEADWDWQGSSEWQGLGKRSNVALQLLRLTFKLQAAMGSFQEPLVVRCRFDHLEEKQEKKKGGKRKKNEIVLGNHV